MRKKKAAGQKTMRRLKARPNQADKGLRSAVMGRGLCMALFFSAALGLAADTFTFKADRMTGGRASGREITVLQGAAEVRSDNLILHADRIELHGADNDFIECSGNVRGRDDEQGIVFRTDRLRYDRKLKIARLEGDSTLEDTRNEVVAKGRFIEYNDTEGTAVIQISVRLFKGEMVCRSEYALYRRNEKTLDLSGFPVVYKKSDEFRADRMQVDLETDDVIMEGAVSGSIKE
jgi:lipopolysaccharide export system protein LptA